MKRLFLVLTVAFLLIGSNFKGRSFDLVDLVDDNTVLYMKMDWQKIKTNEVARFSSDCLFDLVKEFVSDPKFEELTEDLGFVLEIFDYLKGNNVFNLEGIYLAPDLDSDEESGLGNFVLTAELNSDSVTKLIHDPLIAKIQEDGDFKKESLDGIDIYNIGPASFFRWSESKYCVCIGVASLNTCKSLVNNIKNGVKKEQGTGVENKFGKVVSNHPFNSFGIFMNFELFFDSLGAFLREAVAPQAGMSVSIIKNLLGDIDYLAYTANTSADVSTGTAVVSFNSENHGLFKIVEGNLDMKGFHAPAGSTSFHLMHFSWTELWDQMQKIADTLALMFGQKIDLNELIQQYIGEDTNEALIKNLMPVLLVYSYKGDDGKPSPVLQLPAGNTEGVMDYFMAAVEFLHGTLGIDPEDTELEGRNGVSLSFTGEVTVAMVSDSKSVFIGKEDSLRGALSGMSSKDGGCLCCDSKITSLMPSVDKLSGFGFTSGEHLLFQLDYFAELLRMFRGDFDGEDGAISDAFFKYIEHIKSFVKGKNPTAISYSTWEGNVYKHTSKFLTEK